MKKQQEQFDEKLGKAKNVRYMQNTQIYLASRIRSLEEQIKIARNDYYASVSRESSISDAFQSMFPNDKGDGECDEIKRMIQGKINQVESNVSYGLQEELDIEIDFEKELNPITSDTSGDIYKVTKIENGKYYCAKFFISGSSDQFNTPSKEIDIITRLNHPSILKFRGFSPKSNFAVTEILIQNNLETVLNMSENDIPLTKWNDTNKLITIYGVASAMSHIHSEGIIYCCLTPRNILLDEKFHPKISDFSYAKQIDDDFNDISIHVFSYSFTN